MKTRRKKLKKMLIKPSTLPKDERISLRINSQVKEKLLSEGESVQEIFDDAIDSLVKIEVQQTINIEAKKPPKK